MLSKPPIFFIGAPRSGTTVIFEAFSRHESLAWVSNYSRWSPRFPCVNVVRRVFDNALLDFRGDKNQYNTKPLINKVLPRPDEAYEFWQHYLGDRFSRNFLVRQEASPAAKIRIEEAVNKTKKYQGKARIAAKLTGPARIFYLRSIWPDAKFVHVIRDGIDVTYSLLNIDFWINGGGLTSPWWHGGLRRQDIETWKSHQSRGDVLAALQWKRIIELARYEAQELGTDDYLELRYEDFLDNPDHVIAELCQRLGLPPSIRCSTYLDSKFELLDRKHRYLEWSDENIREIEDILQPIFSELGYAIP